MQGDGVWNKEEWKYAGGSGGGGGGGGILFHIHMLNSPLLILAVLSEECCFFIWKLLWIPSLLEFFFKWWFRIFIYGSPFLPSHLENI